MPAYKQSAAKQSETPLAVLRIPKTNLEAPLFDGTDDITLNHAVGRIAGTARPSLGTLIDPRVLLHHLPLLGLMLLLILAGKFLVWASVVGLFRYPIRTAVTVASGLTQIGDLSIVVVQVALSFCRARSLRVAGEKAP
jgi:hypothetical protein